MFEEYNNKILTQQIERLKKIKEELKEELHELQKKNASTIDKKLNTYRDADLTEYPERLDIVLNKWPLCFYSYNIAELRERIKELETTIKCENNGYVSSEEDESDECENLEDEIELLEIEKANIMNNIQNLEKELEAIKREATLQMKKKKINERNS